MESQKFVRDFVFTGKLWNNLDTLKHIVWDVTEKCSACVVVPASSFEVVARYNKCVIQQFP